MPSKKQYNLVHNDENDTRIPLHSDEAFHRGIVFHAKFIGSLEVPRPTSRVEIVAAMRRIRYEFKAKGIKKKKVTLEVSVDGLKVTLRKKKNKQQWIDENKAFQMHYPIYRIFYVSHDSHDLKIFSYIARDGNSNSFKCSVFKSSKKSQAMRVVRTVGQAFEVCHKLSLTAGPEPRDTDLDKEDHLPSDEHLLRSDVYDSEIQNDRQPLTQARTPSPSMHKDLAPSTEIEESPEDTPVIASLRRPPSSPIRHSPSGTLTSDNDPLMLSATELSLKHELQLLRERLDQQSQQTRAAVAHAKLLQDQLAAETAARVEAQTRTHQLLLQNKELLEHIGALVGHLRDQEHSRTLQNVGGSSATVQTTIDPPNLGQPTSPWDLEAYYADVPPTDGEQLRFETQLLERLRNVSPYSLPYSSLLLPSAGGASLRVSQASNLAGRGPDALAELQALIKPLPSTARPSELPRAGPPPSRTTSARLPARADLAAEQRRTWARHTTK